jgi:5'-3' exonuclease
MVEFEADDALADDAAAAARDACVEHVIVCTPDKDLAQCVRGTRVVQLNRRTRVTLDESAIVTKFGVSPASILDYLALVGDAADGYPGLAGWGAKSTAAVLAKYVHLESIPADWREWRVNAANASALTHTLSSELEYALLFRTLATLRTDIPCLRMWMNYSGRAPARTSRPGKFPALHPGSRPRRLHRSPGSSLYSRQCRIQGIVRHRPLRRCPRKSGGGCWGSITLGRAIVAG